MPRLKHLTLALASLALVAAGCAKKFTVEPSYKVPEGTPTANLELITFFDQPNQVITMRDRGNIGVVDITTDLSVADTIVVDTLTHIPMILNEREYTATTARGLVINRTPAEGMELFRSDPNGGLRLVFPEALQADRRYLDQRVEMYSFADPDPKRSLAANYTVRGLVGGVGGGSSPISNASQPTATSIAQISYLPRSRNGVDPDSPGIPSSNDSILTLKWSAVNGTNRYWIQIFQYLPTLIDQTNRIFAGAAAPLVTRKTRDFFIATVPGTQTRYKMGTTGATIYTARTMPKGDEYFLRISAVNSAGELIGMTTGPHIAKTSDLQGIKDVNDFFTLFSADGTYQLWSKGAVRIVPAKLPATLTP